MQGESHGSLSSPPCRRLGSPYRGILFDLDGTLVDSFPAVHAALTATMRRLGIRPWGMETMKQHVGRGLEYLVGKAVGEHRKQGAIRLFRKQYAESCLQETYLLPSVAETLSWLYGAGYRLAVTTNKSLTFTKPILRHLRVDRYFACILGPEEVARPKPYPDMLLAALDRLGLDKKEALYVGDMPLDVETASSAGLDCVLVATGPYPYSVLAGTTPVPVLEHLGRLLDLHTPVPGDRTP